MSLRRKDDWDEALEEAEANAIKRGDIVPSVQNQLPNGYDYCASVVITREELISEHLLT